MKLKVCGINNADFAVKAAELGVDYLGFIFHPASPRHVTVEQAKAISKVVPRCVSPEQPSEATQPKAAGNRPKPVLVGVFVKQSVDEILATMRVAQLDIVQLHRRATAEDVAAIRAAGYEVWTLAGGAPGDGVLFDSSHGDGETDFRKGDYTAILAGRMGVDNLAEALALQPDLLDVNSSLETAPGVKSIDRLVRFLDSLDAETALCL